MIINSHPDRKHANAADLAADYKSRGYTRFYAWDMFVRDRDLSPEMSAKEFYSLFDSVVASSMTTRRNIDFTPTHIDTNMGGMLCQVKDMVKWYDIVWACGMTGSNPHDNTFGDRFKEIQ